MRYVTIKLLSFFLVAAILILLGLACCDDCSTCPEPPVEVQEHYKMYVLTYDLDLYQGVLLVLDIPADTIIDSVRIPDASASLYITADNQKLIMYNDGNMIVYNANDLTYDTTLDWLGRYYSDRSRNINLVDTYNKLLKFDPSDFTVLDSLAVNMGYGQLDTVNAILYVAKQDDPRVIYRIDYLTMTIVDSLVIRDSLDNPILAFKMLPVPEYERLYFRGRIGLNSYSFIYDLKNGQIVSQIQYSAQYGTFLKGADGRTVYMSDPGDEFSGTHGSFYIWLYSLPDDSVKGFYSTLSRDVLGTRQLDIQDMLLSPDGRYLYAGCGVRAGLIKYDLSTGLSTSLLSLFYPPSVTFAIEIGDRIE